MLERFFVGTVFKVELYGISEANPIWGHKGNYRNVVPFFIQLTYNDTHTLNTIEYNDDNVIGNIKKPPVYLLKAFKNQTFNLR